jgi:HSP20 family protein
MIGAEPVNRLRTCRSAHPQEYQIGDFECDFTVSSDFGADKIEASLMNGVLQLTVPRAEQAEARTIKITAGS